MWWCSVQLNFEMRLLRDHRFLSFFHQFFCRRSFFPSCFFSASFAVRKINCMCSVSAESSAMYVKLYYHLRLPVQPVSFSFIFPTLYVTFLPSTFHSFYEYYFFFVLYSSSSTFCHFQFVCSFLAFCLVILLRFCT